MVLLVGYIRLGDQMRTSYFVAAGIFIASFSGCTFAGNVTATEKTFVPAAEIGTSIIDFDTADGSYSKWRIDNLGTLNSVRTTMQIKRRGPGARWLPFLGIALLNGDDRVAFRIIAKTPNAPFTLSLSHLHRGDQVEEQVFSTTVGLNEKIDVVVSWTTDGIVTVNVGDEAAHVLSLGRHVTSLQLSGSTCDGHFDPIQIGYERSAKGS